MSSASPSWQSRLGRRLKLRDLHILATVVKWGSMAKAAGKLAMSQPAVSESVANLEAVLRVRLLDRSARGVAPTIYASALLDRIDVVFDELGRAVEAIEFLSDPNAGEVRVAAGDTFTSGLLPAAIDGLHRARPRVAIRVVPSNAETLDFRDLRERKVDLALARVPRAFADDGLDVEILFDDPHRVVVGELSPLARRRKVALHDLVDEPWIYASNQVIRDLMAEAFGLHGLEAPPESVTASSILLRNSLLATGRFVTILPDSVLRYNGERWGIKALPIDLGVTPRSAAAVTLANRTLAPVGKLFLAQVRLASRGMAR
jgi:DNA-binding transcriptional LysR family regulator